MHKSYGEFGELVQLQFEHPAYPLELLESLRHKLTDRRGVPIVPPISNFRSPRKFPYLVRKIPKMRDPRNSQFASNHKQFDEHLF